MKRILLFLIGFIGLTIAIASQAERGILPAGVGVAGMRDSATSVLRPTYTTGSGITNLTGLSGKYNLYVSNGGTTGIALSTRTATTDCVGGSDNVMVPASTSAPFLGLSINGNVCVRSLSGVIGTGQVTATVW